MGENRILLGIKEFSAVSGLGEKTVRRFCHIDDFPAMICGVKIMIHLQRASEWLADYAQNSRVS